MNLLAILFALSIERIFEPIERLRDFHWFTLFADWVKTTFTGARYWNDTAGVLMTVLLPVVICGIVYAQLDALLALLGFLFSIVVLLYCLGPKRVHHIVKLYVDASEHDDQSHSRAYAVELLQRKMPDSDTETNRAIAERTLVSTNEQLVAILFWFVVLGPVGALLIKLSGQLREHAAATMNEETTDYTEYKRISVFLYAILIWLPTQVMILCFAITGSFVDVIHEWKMSLSHDFLNPGTTRETLLQTGFKALQIDPNTQIFSLATVREVLALCWRSIVVFVTIIALLTLAGLAG
jgi:membrane protein required for beta-lactamase induction